MTAWQPKYRFMVPVIGCILLLLSWIVRLRYFDHSALASGLFNSAIALILLNSFLQTNTKKARIILIATLALLFGGFWWWRNGKVVAHATFDPGIAPFTIEVRKVPVPVTNSSHFIISLFRGQYVVTSFRYFWPGYTPKHVTIAWPCISHFSVTFDGKYEAICDWNWGRGASWSMTTPPNSLKPGLSPYFFRPRKPPPAGCTDGSDFAAN
jgi:hypothetical protein